MFSFPKNYIPLPKTEVTEANSRHSELIEAVETTDPTHSRPEQSRYWHYILLSTTAISLLFALLLIWKWPMVSKVQNVLDNSGYHCGNTTAEAKSLGCEFDVLSNAWMPKQCLDVETAAEFREWLLSKDRRPYGPFPFFADSNGHQRIPDEETLSEQTDQFVWRTEEQHFGHCIFLMQRLS